VAEFFITGERVVVFNWQLQAAEMLSELSAMNVKSSFVNVKVPVVITNQLKLYSIFQEQECQCLTLMKKQAL
jgi:hypothetical protein